MSELRTGVLALVLMWAAAVQAITPVAPNRTPTFELVAGDASKLKFVDWQLSVDLQEGKAVTRGVLTFRAIAARKFQFRLTPQAQQVKVDGRLATGSGPFEVTMSKPGSFKLEYETRGPTVAPDGWVLQIGNPVAFAQVPSSGHLEVRAVPAYVLAKNSSPRWKRQGDHWEATVSNEIPSGSFEARVKRGILKPMEMSFQMQGTHQLLDDNGHLVAILQSADPKLDLGKYNGQRVDAFGEFERTVEGQTLFIRVRQVIPVKP